MKHLHRSCSLLCAILLAAASFSGCKGKTQNTTDRADAAAETQTQPTAAVSAAETSETAQAETTAPATEAATTAAAQNANDGNAAAPESNPVPTQRVGNGIHPLTGLPGYDSDYYAHSKVIGVVVENHPGARPQWGMSTPDVVFEYDVEGGISRMLWLYANMDELPAKVGPVRSMRHDIVELARGYDLFFIHCGGSSFARDKLASYNGALAEIDGMTFGDCFVRDTTRNVATEHRLLLLGDAFRTAVVNRGLNMTADGTHQNFFRFADAQNSFPAGDAACSSLHIEYSPDYTYTFRYNSGTGLYEANINGAPRTDDVGTLCAYKNLVILYVDMEDMHTSAGHQDLKLENGGSGIYAANGTYAPITWQKGTDVDMLKLYNTEGKELTLNAGKSYIGLVRSTRSDRTTVS